MSQQFIPSGFLDWGPLAAGFACRRSPPGLQPWLRQDRRCAGCLRVLHRVSSPSLCAKASCHTREVAQELAVLLLKCCGFAV